MKRYIKSSRDTAQVGIWWFTDENEIWMKGVPTNDGEQVGAYIQYSEHWNHLNSWSSVVKSHLSGETANIRIAKGFKSFERGRVIYNCQTCCYEVTCSDALLNNSIFRNAVVDAFDLRGNRIDFVALQHYHKEELTGNPVLDDFYYENQF